MGGSGSYPERMSRHAAFSLLPSSRNPCGHSLTTIVQLTLSINVASSPVPAIPPEYLRHVQVKSSSGAGAP